MSGASDLDTCLATKVRWRDTGQGEFPYAARIDGRDWTIRVNDFPAEPFYSLLINGAVVGSFDDWPAAWLK